VRIFLFPCFNLAGFVISDKRALAAVQSSRFKSSRWSWGRFQQFQPFQASRQFKVQRFNVQWPHPITDFP